MGNSIIDGIIALALSFFVMIGLMFATLILYLGWTYVTTGEWVGQKYLFSSEPNADAFEKALAEHGLPPANESEIGGFIARENWGQLQITLEGKDYVVKKEKGMLTMNAAGKPITFTADKDWVLFGVIGLLTMIIVGSIMKLMEKKSK